MSGLKKPRNPGQRRSWAHRGRRQPVWLWALASNFGHSHKEGASVRYVRSHFASRTAPSAAGAGRVQRHGRANKSLQCLLVNLLALVEVDGAPGGAIEAGIEQA